LAPEKKALMGKCTDTIHKMGPRILKKGRDPEKCTSTFTKMGATMENVPVQLFSLSTKTLAITTENLCFHEDFFFCAKSVCTT
jgi:hypothetical protein